MAGGTNRTVMKMGKFFNISLIALLVASVMMIGLEVSASTPYFSGKKIIDYKAQEINKPFRYWTLTEPDAYILKAISDLDTWINAPENETTFLDQVYEHDNIWEIEYEEHYYAIEALYHYDTCLPKYYIIHRRQVTSPGGIILAVSWVALAIVWVKKRNQSKTE